MQYMAPIGPVENDTFFQGRGDEQVNESVDIAVNGSEKIAAANNEQVNKEYSYGLCDFNSNWYSELNIHIGRMHSRIEDLEG